MPPAIAVQTAERPKQARSKARRQALIAYGATLFNDRDLDEVSISEITQGVQFSTGSFYSYFADKSELFVAVQAYVAAQMDSKLLTLFPADANQPLPLQDRLRISIDFALSYFRTHTGLVRSALRYERRIPEAWQPNRETTAQIVALAVAGLPAAQAHKLEAAIQMAFGVMVNALLHDPGPMRLRDPNLAETLVAMLSPYLETDHD